MENYLIDTGLKDAVLVDQAEGQIAGEDLRHRVERAVRARHFMEPLVRKVGNADVVAQAAIAGVLPAAILAADAQASQAAQDIATRLAAMAPEHETGWPGRPLADGATNFTTHLGRVAAQRLIAAPQPRSRPTR